MLSSAMPPLRKIAFLCSVLFTILFSIPSLLLAQCGGLGTPPPSEGREFLLCFMQNEASNYRVGNPANYQDIYLASAGDTADVTITCRAFPGWSRLIKLAKGGSFVYRLSNDTIIGLSAIMESPSSPGASGVGEVIDSTVFKVVSTTPIACYGMNNKDLTADAFLALPIEVASTEYRIMSYYNSTEQTGMEMPSEFSVAAFDDNTMVTIIPSATTSAGTPAGTTITYILNEGEGILVQAEMLTKDLDLTGSIVRSDKPIVVYGGHARAEVTADLMINNGFASRDHLCEAMPPVSDWGTSFVAKNFGRTDIEGDVMRVLALNANTVVKINGITWGAPLGANKFRDTIIWQDNTIPINNVAAVESNNPVLVGMIAHSAKSNSGLGDPFLAIVPPLNQTYNDFTYFITTDTAIDYDPSQQFLIVATEISGKNSISIDNIQIPGNKFDIVPQPMRNTKYAVATIPQSPGIHHIVSQEQPLQGFTILAYGWGTVVSYGYTAGLLFDPYTGIIPIPSPDHGVAPFPGDTLRNLASPTITIRNILTERIYFDSAKVTYSQNPQNISVRLQKDIAMETGTIEMAEEKTLELVTAKPIQQTISGTVRIWYHSALWMGMQPVDFPFTITPDQPQAGVTPAINQNVVLENYPNPASGKTTVHFRIPSRSYVSVKIYDALGRTIRTLMQSVVNSDDQQVQMSTKGIPAGEYTLELIAPELGISEHRQLLVIE
jgi:hypothetical protein